MSSTPNSNYAFKEWQVVSGNITITNNKFTIGTSNVEIKAIFELLPEAITYKNTKGNNSSWTKGSSNTLDLTFKRSEQDNEGTYNTHFSHIEIDDNKVNNDKYTIGYGSIIIKLKPELLNDLSVGDHTLKIVFDDGEASAKFTIKEKGNNNNNNNSNNKPYIIPKTGVE